MNLKTIKKAVDEGKTVNWFNPHYKVIKQFGEYFIYCSVNTHRVRLTNSKGVLIPPANQFYVEAD